MTTLIKITGLQASNAGAQSLSVSRGFRVPNPSGAADLNIQPGTIYSVDIDNPQTRKRLGRHFDQWIEVPGNDLTQVVLRSLLIPSPTDSTQSLISRGFFIPDKGYGYVGVSGLQPTLTTTGGANSNLTFTALADGTSAVTVAYVQSGNNTPLSVGVSGNAITVNLATTGGAAATATVSASGAPADGNTVVVNSRTYTFKTALTPAAGEVLINGQDGSITNLIHAINQSGGTAGTDYVAGAANADATAGALGTPSHGTTLTAIVAGTAGNSLTLTKVGANLAVSGATFSGGTQGTISSTGAQVLGALQQSNAQSLITSALATGNDGTGVVGAFGATGLSLGTPNVQDLSGTGPLTVDLTDPYVRRSVREHIGRWVVADSSDTLVTIRGLLTTSSVPGGGLSGRGFRIAKYGAVGGAGSSAVADVTPTTSVQVDVSDWNVRRTLRRNVGRWVVVSAP